MTLEGGVWAVVPAAGAGLRMGADRPKQYLPLLGKVVVLHTLERLCACTRIGRVYIGVSPDDPHWPTLATQAGRLGNFGGRFDGGRERADTVLNGLRHLLAHGARAGDWVLVHDAARPCVRVTDIERLLALADDQGALLALPVSDTVKRVDARDRVVETVPRSGLWRALTPQVFPLGRLLAALERARERGEQVTDEASAIERDGGHPRVVEGHADNIKITQPGDLALAEIVLRRQEELG